MGKRIDPATCKPDEAWAVTVTGRNGFGFRVDPNDFESWMVMQGEGDYQWEPDSVVTPLHRLVPELPDADTLRKAATIIADQGFTPTTLTTVEDVVDYLEGQAGRLESDPKLEALIEKATGEVLKEMMLHDVQRGHSRPTLRLLPTTSSGD